LIHTVPSDLPRATPPAGLQLLGRIVGYAWQQARVEGPLDGLRVLVMAWRLLGEREKLGELFTIPAFAQMLALQPQADPLFFISHRHFLSRGLSASERLGGALDHFHFKQSRFTPALLEMLHEEGLLLWRQEPGWEIRLRANAEIRHEGPLSLALTHEGRRLHEMSFAWVNAERLGMAAGPDPVLFATRSQCAPSDAPHLARFRTDFPQNSPAYFGLAALNGIVTALGQSRIVGVRDVCQIAFEPRYAASFKRSYDEFWSDFGGRLVGEHGLEMPVPAAVTPLSELRAKHRARARQRREHWRLIAESAEAALSPYLIR
jgi:uncharacterized protein VirK/YbjX